MRRAAAACGVQLVTGDTKVVDRGKGDGLFINTAGIGVVRPACDRARGARGPATSCSSPATCGRHGIAVMSVREGSTSRRRSRATARRVAARARAARRRHRLHCLRDPTRGGLATALNEIALDADVGIELDETAVPVAEVVAGACELLGLRSRSTSPAKGACSRSCSAGRAERALARPCGRAARGRQVVGSVRAEDAGRGDAARTRIGSHRLLERLSGEQLPRNPPRHGFRPDATGRVRLGPQGGGIVWPA